MSGSGSGSENKVHVTSSEKILNLLDNHLKGVDSHERAKYAKHFIVNSMVDPQSNVTAENIINALDCTRAQIEFSGKTPEIYLNICKIFKICVYHDGDMDGHFTPNGKVILGDEIDKLINLDLSENDFLREAEKLLPSDSNRGEFMWGVIAYYSARNEHVPRFLRRVFIKKDDDFVLNIPQIIMLKNCYLKANCKKKLNISVVSEKKEGLSDKIISEIEEIQMLENEDDTDENKSRINDLKSSLQKKFEESDDIISTICMEKLWSTCRTGKSYMQIICALFPIERLMRRYTSENEKEFKLNLSHETPMCYICLLYTSPSPRD